MAAHLHSLKPESQRRTPAQRFFTPQVRRDQTWSAGPKRQARKSLSDTFGPPVRFQRTPVKVKQEEVSEMARDMQQIMHISKPAGVSVKIDLLTWC